ncbi:MAG: glutamine--fructose-6-phosphate transaminase (isomerizing), partial [Puniceicoccales bacterium]|nr:glutamine--fructose-6-phosphate transaminase (isomerizing) [Puniceicoccales bacterium]
MCGILGYIGKNDAVQIIIEGLKRLEYRGYDSAGLLVSNENHPGWAVVKSLGRVENLAARGKGMKGRWGMGHTRWATHGEVSEVNTHPHVSADGKIAVVHNGVIENYGVMKEFLKEKGIVFQGETDTEVLANWIAYQYVQLKDISPGDAFLESVRLALLDVQGSYGIGVMCVDCPGEMVGARRSSPLMVGVGEKEMFLSNDVGAFAGHTREVVFLADGEMVHLSASEMRLQSLGKSYVEVVVETIDWDIHYADLGSYSTYMEKEIFEQPISLENTVRGRFSKDESSVHLGGLQMTAQELKHVDRILFLACGTAWHAGMVAKYLIERFARLPVDLEYASEFRYRNAVLDRNTLVFVISQSGETLDTIAALRESLRKGYRTLAISNVAGSTIARESDGGVYQRSGPEIGVASTKAFTGQLCVIAMLAIYFARLRDMGFPDGVGCVKALRELPEKVDEVLKRNAHIASVAQKYGSYDHFLFLGRQSMFPIALEGALKLKEVSYIHAEGYPAAELKHGPIALIDEKCPSLFLATDPDVFGKTVGNMMEVKARGGSVVAVGVDGSNFPEESCDDVLWIPPVHPLVLP